MRTHPLSLPLCALALLALGFPADAAAPAAAASTLALNSLVIDTAAAPPELPAHLSVGSESLADERTRPNEYFLVQFPAPVTAEQRAALEAAVERVYTYLPHHAYLVKTAPATARDPDLLGRLGASWIGPYQPGYKISRFLAAVDPAAPGFATAPEELRSVLLHVYPDADLGEIRQRLSSLGVARIAAAGRSSRFSRVRILLTAAEIARLRETLSQLREVFWIDLEGRRVLLNDTTVWVGQSGLAGGQTTPVHDHGIFGEGQVVGVLDTGIDPDMCYFRDPARGLPPINPCDGGILTDPAQRKLLAVDFLWDQDCAGGVSNSEWDNHDHGTHVAGTAVGDDFANPLVHDGGDGMAPGAKLIVQDGGFSTGDNCADLPGLGCPVVDLVPIFRQAYDQGARIHTNSWGDRENFTPLNIYSAGSEDADQIMWSHKDFLLLFAAGNAGTSAGTVLSPATAKSVVAVGATQRSTSADSLASFTSCGPTDDGRIKPDVMVPGVSIVSANNDLNAATNNCATRTMSGTSMASPGGAGLAALARQYYTDGFYPTGTAQAADGFTPSGALVKASLVNSAADMANVAAIPSDCQGWGRVLLDDVLFFPGDPRRLFVHDEAAGFAAAGETRTFQLDVGSAESLKVTLAWTDFPSTPAAAIHLVNDLDLEVTGPSGTFLGNVFSGGVSAGGGGADRLNTVEQILLPTPAPGTYTVTVRAFAVPSGPQDFALVASGELDPCQATCGNGVIECNELCDGADLGGATCTDQSCTGGTLACNATCDGFDTTACTGCPVCNDNGVCEAGEDCQSCPGDCASGTTSGAICGNGLCEAGNGEDCVSCPADCNGRQNGKPSGQFCCGDGDGTNPLPCSDAACDGGGFACTDVPVVPGSFCCGLFGCESGESCGNCALDCAAPAEQCTDGTDNDCNGAADCADAACSGDPACNGGGCTAGQPGDACTTDADCCSLKCRGPAGSQTCR